MNLRLLFELFTLLTLASLISIFFLSVKGRGITALAAITLQVVVSSILAVFVFKNGTSEFYYPGSWVTGPIAIRIDYLSAWFILTINFTFLTGSWYGFQYLKRYINESDKILLHIMAFLLLYSALICLCVVQNSFVFLVLWEIMTLACFIVIIFESQKPETLRAGLNFLIQSHIGILFLTIAFMWVKIKTGTFDFKAIALFTSSQPLITGTGLFFFFFIAFAVKAGFIPFHTWLPLAHPAAPSHISAIMSGVIIKIGIYGIFRILMLIKTDMGVIGYFMLAVSVATGIYGVMLAIIQHNLKKLLAYHSIENIGIIGIGIGLGCLGIHYNNSVLIVLGFGGGLLHTLNHSLFKSLLFFTAGNIYQANHTMNIDMLGGLIKKMPKTAYLFLIGSLAICGLPPLNGFVSEFLIYSGLFHGFVSSHFPLILSMLFTILGLVLIGGLAMICFTKAFGIVFLGNARSTLPFEKSTENPLRIVPLYLIATAILLIGLFPQFILPAIQKTVSLLSLNDIQPEYSIKSLHTIGWYSVAFFALILSIYLLRNLILKQRNYAIDTTWGCGYTGNMKRMQYTASSFVRSYRKMAEPLLLIKKNKKDADNLFPLEINQFTHPEDKIEKWLIDKPLLLIRRFVNRFIFLQNGNLQAYILYGFVFIGVAILLPILVEKVITMIKFLYAL
jgi:hydrogenase-4 component B